MGDEDADMAAAIAMSLANDVTDPDPVEDITGTLEADISALNASLLGTLAKLLENIVKHPAEEKYRFLKGDAKSESMSAVLASDKALSFLARLGFVGEAGGQRLPLAETRDCVIARFLGCPYVVLLRSHLETVTIAYVQSFLDGTLRCI